MRRSARILAMLLLATLAVWANPASPVLIVICAPGYPGDTESAQPTMDDLARRLAEITGHAPTALSAVYHPVLEAGLEQLGDGKSSVALVSLPFYLEFREQLELKPLLQIEHAGVEAEQWALVARRSAISDPGSLAGWELAGMAGYAPNFVRRVALADWGRLPEQVDIRFSKRVISKLRSAAAGEQVAVLLDTGQTEAMSRLDFADQLEVVARSGRFPASLVCAIGERLNDEALESLRRGFLGLRDADGGPELLESIRIDRFVALDTETLATLEQAYGRD